MDNLNNIAAQLESLKMQVSGLESSLRVNNSFQTGQVINAGTSPITLTTASKYSVGTEMAATGAVIGSALTWPTGAPSCFVPINIPFPLLAGAPTAGVSGSSYSTAIYDRHGNKLIDSSISTKIVLPPGLYYLAVLATTPATATFAGWTTGTGTTASLFDVWWQNTSASLPAQRPQSDVLGLSITKVPLLIIGFQFWQPT